jgi:hypothetical protein
MESHHVFSQLVLFALIWLFIMLHLTRPKRPRPNEPKPFEGLTHKPHGALCERDTADPQAPPRPKYSEAVIWSNSRRFPIQVTLP